MASPSNKFTGTGGRPVYIFTDTVAAIEAADNGNTYIHTTGGRLEVKETAKQAAARMGFKVDDSE